MTERKPGFVLLFSILLSCSLLGLAFVFPEDGVVLPYDITLRFPTVEHLLGEDQVEYADISEAISMAEKLSEVEEESEVPLESLESDTQIAIITDSAVALVDTLERKRPFVPKRKPKKVNVDSLRAAEKYVQPIEFKDKNPSVLYKFFAALDEVAYKGGKTHVMHYGDSQIEGDRMTSYIRDKLQKRFGGSGVGLLPASNVNAVPIIGHSSSANWNRYPGFITEGEKGGTDKYGALCSYSTYTPYPKSTSLSESDITEAWLRYNAGDAIYNNCKTFQQVKMFYGPVEDAVKLTFPVDDTVFSDYFKGRKELNHIALSFNSPRKEIELRFKSKMSPQIYAVSLEGLNGVQVSNVAMRGSSGTVFHKMDNKILGEMLTELNTSLIILQYGGNVMPYMETKKQAEDYGRWFYRQIKLLQSACPGASIVVIGPSDMSKKNGERYETYPLLEDVRNALRSATLKADAGYWDMYEAMGGKNSMPSWVEADPPLAITDYTHFTPRGARIISEFFYKALMIEYEAYNSQNQVP